MFDLQDTIVALATPRGGALRGILRLSGSRCWEVVQSSFSLPLPPPSEDFRPQAVTGNLSLPSLAMSVPATLLLCRAPRSYTGQDTVEVHTLGSPPILELALSTFVSRGARQALPGEFTMRAFLAGKLDLTAAEAVLGLIEATNPQQADVALRQLAGGIARPLGELRDRLLDLVAELEAGLDFAEEDLEFIERNELRTTLRTAIEQLHELGRQMQERSLSLDRPRAVLVGLPNVGKSSLFNALVGRDAALVSHTAGTTRDYIVAGLALTDCTIELVDTAGIDNPTDAISHQAQSLRDQVVQNADLLLWCLDSSDPTSLACLSQASLQQIGGVLLVLTKSDLAATNPNAASILHPPSSILNQLGLAHPSPLTTASPPLFVSSLRGEGLDDLRRAIADWIHGSRECETGVVAGTAARCRQAIAGAEAAAVRALAALDSDAGDDLIAAELRLALDELALVVGAVYTDDILDRIFSRFCIGK